MPFRLCNAPATFERLMDQVLQGLRWSRCLVYLDDIISFGTTFEDALDNLTLIFERLCTYRLQLKSTKCRHHPLGNIPTGHRWDRIAMDILDACDPTPDGYRYILVIADYFSKWTEAFPIKDKCADTVADVHVLVDKIILRFGMPLIIHSDQGAGI